MNLSMALFRTPVVALMPDITPSHFRSQANGIVNFMGGLGALLVFFAGKPLYDSNITFYIAILFLIGGFGWALINVNSLPMVVDMATLKKVGGYTGLYYFFLRQPILLILSFRGYLSTCSVILPLWSLLLSSLYYPL